MENTRDYPPFISKMSVNPVSFMDHWTVNRLQHIPSPFLHTAEEGSVRGRTECWEICIFSLSWRHSILQHGPRLKIEWTLGASCLLDGLLYQFLLSPTHPFQQDSHQLHCICWLQQEAALCSGAMGGFSPCYEYHGAGSCVGQDSFFFRVIEQCSLF